MSIYLAMGADEFRAQPDLSTHYYALLGLWRAEVETLAQSKEDEMHYRKLLCDVTFIDPKEGSNTHYFGDNKKAAKLTMSHKINRTVDPAAIGHCLSVLRDTIGETADNVVRYKPELSVTAYKALTDTQQLILAPAITSSPGSPSLKFVDAKE